MSAVLGSSALYRLQRVHADGLPLPARQRADELRAGERHQGGGHSLSGREAALCVRRLLVAERSGAHVPVDQIGGGCRLVASHQALLADAYLFRGETNVEMKMSCGLKSNCAREGSHLPVEQTVR